MRRTILAAKAVAAAATSGVVLFAGTSATLASTTGSHVADRRVADIAETLMTTTAPLAAPVAVVADAESAARTATVNVPTDPADGVTMKITENRALTIALPNTRTLGKGTRVTRGAVAYRGSAGSAAVIPTEKGVQFLAVIDNRQSPSAYAYTVSGGHIELLPGGGAIVRDGDGHPAALVPAPWARDANGAHLKTWFTANGTTLTQHIAHRGHGVTYPVVADPFWIPAWAVAQIIRCGAGGYLGWIAAGGWDWWERALAVAAGCLIGTR